MGLKDKMLIVRYRMGGELGTAQYWREKTERVCKVCGEEEESLPHVVEQCGMMRDSLKDKRLGIMLSKDGGGSRDSGR